MTSAERWLSLALRVLAIPVLMAIPCALLPVGWMNSTHQWLGLGPMPEAPILEYLARSSSLLYGFHGLLLLLVATDVRRYLPVIWLLGVAGFAFGVAMFAIDHAAGLPAHWRWIESGAIVVESSVVLVLAWRAARAMANTHLREARSC